MLGMADSAVCGGKEHGDRDWKVAPMIREPPDPVIHSRLIHRPARGPLAGLAGDGHTGSMSDSSTLQSWAARLDDAASALSHDPTAPSVYEALALAWQTAKLVGQPASPATALSWMRLAEALSEAWADLTVLADPPGPVPFDPGAPPQTGVLDDTPQLRGSVARLLRATAAAVRELAGADGHSVDTALALAIIASTLDDTARDWP
jgi:hypothetical protein